MAHGFHVNGGLMQSTQGARGIHRRIEFMVTDNLIKRFWAGVEKGTEKDCWNWTKSQRNGYGAIKHQKKVLGAHRVSYQIHFGDVPEGHVLRHMCDNKLCTNPNHLITGTPKENLLDAIERGQWRPLIGEMHPQSTFSDALVRAVWELRRLTGFGCRRLEDMLHLKRDSLRLIFEKGKYAHLTPEWAKAKN